MKDILRGFLKRPTGSSWVWVLVVHVAGCHDQPSAPQESPDLSREFVAPDSCTVRRADPSCTTDDASEAAGGAAGAGGTAGVASDSGTSKCLVRSEFTLSCPSQVGALYTAHDADGSLDIVIAQLGLDGRGAQGEYLQNHLAYAEAHRIAESEETRFEERVVPPFVATPDALEKGLTLIPATGSVETLLVEHLATGEETPGTLRLKELFGDGDALADFPLSEAPIVNATGTSAEGAGVFVEYQPFHHFVLVAGLPDAPRLIQPGTPPSALAVGADATGKLHALTHDRMNLTGWSGPNLDQRDYQLPADTGVNSPSVDFVFVGAADETKQVILYRHGDTDDHQVAFVNANHEASPPAAVAHYAASDCNSFGIGFTCDDCPEGRQCQVHEENVREARLFSRGQRVFAAYVATDTVQTRVAVKHTTGIGIGCTCGTDEVSTQTVGDTLVAFEVSEAQPGVRPEVVEIMREPLDAAGSGRVFFERDRNGNLDLVLGPSFGRFQDGLAEFPEAPREYRVIRLSGLTD